MDVTLEHPELVQSLASIVGAENVLTGDEDREFYSQDIYRTADHFAAVVVRPGDPDEVARVTAAATSAGFTVLARGGGSSYTGGLLPDRPNSVSIDTARLGRSCTRLSTPTASARPSGDRLPEERQLLAVASLRTRSCTAPPFTGHRGRAFSGSKWCSRTAASFPRARGRLSAASLSSATTARI